MAINGVLPAADQFFRWSVSGMIWVAWGWGGPPGWLPPAVFPEARPTPRLRCLSEPPLL